MYLYSYSHCCIISLPVCRIKIHWQHCGRLYVHRSFINVIKTTTNTGTVLASTTHCQNQTKPNQTKPNQTQPDLPKMTIVNSSMIAVQSISRTVRFMANAHASLRQTTLTKSSSSSSNNMHSHMSRSSPRMTMMKSVDDVVRDTILSPQYFPTFLGCSMAFSFVGGYMYMESLRQSDVLSLSRHHTTTTTAHHRHRHRHHHHHYDAATSETTTVYTTPLRMLYE